MQYHCIAICLYFSKYQQEKRFKQVLLTNVFFDQPFQVICQKVVDHQFDLISQKVYRKAFMCISNFLLVFCINLDNALQVALLIKGLTIDNNCKVRE